MSNYFILLFSLLIGSVASLKNKSLECKDTSHECKDIKGKCGDVRHSWLVKLKCPKTCNACVIIENKKPKEEKCKDIYPNCYIYLENNCKNEVCFLVV
jgi:hypothetical protein